MRTTRSSLALAILALCLCPARAQTGGATGADGAIVEQALYVLPTYEEIAAPWNRVYTREAVERIRNAPDLEVLKIKYLSDGLKVAGFIYKPKATAGKKFPTIIFNRGGGGEDAKIGPLNFNYLAEMHRYASEGFVVIASQYRGVDGAGGRDEAGGADTNDVMNLIPLARSLGYVDADKLFMWGYSRGAIMTLQAVRRGAPIRAAVVVGAPTDYFSITADAGFLRFARETFPDFERRKDEHLRSRSAVYWADQINVPLLIVHGGADTPVTPRHALALARKMDEAGKLYELVVYAKDNHPVVFNAEDRLRRTVDWFKNVRTISVAQAIERTIREKGVADGIRQYRGLKKTHSHVYDFGEPELNRLGYELLGSGLVKEAVEVFKLNVEMFPEAFNTYDSLGEAHAAAGERELAVKNYKRSLELNPQNTNAAAALKRLGQK